MVTCRAHSAERPSPDDRTGQIGCLSRRLLGSLTPNLTRGQTRLFVFMVLTAVVFLTSVPPTVSADGNVYYVATNGSDDSFGSDDQPWRTIQKAANTLAPGDTVIVRAGLYQERVEINVNGLPGQPITFQGERGTNGEGVSIIDAGDRVREWVPAPEVGAGV